MKTLFLLFSGLSLGVALLSLLLAWHRVDVFPTTHTRVGGILLGVLLAILYHYAPETFHRLQTWRFLWIGFVLAALVFAGLNTQKWWTGAISFDLADLAGVGLLMLLYKHREGRRHSVVYRTVAWVGLYSYGIYLWHVAAAMPAQRAAHYLPAWLVPALLGLAPPVIGTLLGVITTKLIELPTLRLRDKWFPRRVDSAVGIPAEQEPLETEPQAKVEPPTGATQPSTSRYSG